MEPIKTPADEFLSIVLVGLVTYPKDVQVAQTVDEMGILLSVSVNREDMGKIIGKSGDIAKAIRRLMNGFGYLRRQKISVKIVDPSVYRA